MIEERRQRAKVCMGPSEARFEIRQNRTILILASLSYTGKRIQFLIMWEEGSQLHQLTLVWKCQPLHFLIKRLERTLIDKRMQSYAWHARLARGLGLAWICWDYWAIFPY